MHQTHGGLSPLARGNPIWVSSWPPSTGPIPARAGEPPRCALATACARAYPRSRGGTMTAPSMSLARRGLSPLARGNRRSLRPQWRFLGPIPARAGEPLSSCLFFVSSRAYPRSRGGTDGVGMKLENALGLSPLARGNLSTRTPAAMFTGPIPARAGEPSTIMVLCPALRAYPRSRGGTFQVAVFLAALLGLSPLARGNRHRRPCQHSKFGPIPARAGEPLHGG